MRLRTALFGAALLLCVPAIAHAQAYVDEANSLSAGISYTYAPSGKIVVEDNDIGIDKYAPGVPMHIHILRLDAQWVTPLDGLAVEGTLPVVGAKLESDSFEHFPVKGEWDDAEFHQAVTDIRAGLRYQVKAIERHLGLAFVLAGSYPMDYPVNGLTAPGHGLKQAHFGVALARTFDPVISDLYFQIEYEFSLRERVDVDEATKEINRNRSDTAVTLGYFLPKGFTVGVGGSWGYNHGGITFSEIIFAPESVQEHHDRLLKESWLLAGFDVGYEITDSMDLGLTYRKFLWGTATRNQDLFGLQLYYKFF